jgi:hypothetical protein
LGPNLQGFLTLTDLRRPSVRPLSPPPHDLHLPGEQDRNRLWGAAIRYVQHLYAGRHFEITGDGAHGGIVARSKSDLSADRRFGSQGPSETASSPMRLRATT